MCLLCSTRYVCTLQLWIIAYTLDHVITSLEVWRTIPWNMYSRRGDLTSVISSIRKSEHAVKPSFSKWTLIVRHLCGHHTTLPILRSENENILFANIRATKSNPTIEIAQSRKKCDKWKQPIHNIWQTENVRKRNRISVNTTTQCNNLDEVQERAFDIAEQTTWYH